MVRVCAHVNAVVFLLVSALLGTSAIASTPRDPLSSGGDAAMVRIPGHVLPALAKATLVRTKTPASMISAEANQTLTLTIVLKRDDEPGFERYLHEVYDAHSKNFRHFLTQPEIASRFGPSQKTYDTVLAYLRAHGFTLAEGSTNRLTVTVKGTRGAAQNAFDVGIGDYRVGQTSFYANDRDPGLPQALARRVQSIVGLSNAARPKPTWAAESAANAALYCQIASLACVEKAFSRSSWQKYCFDTLKDGISHGSSIIPLIARLDCTHSGGPLSPVAASEARGVRKDFPFDGTGQTIGLIEFDNFNQSDVADYLTYTGFDSTEIGNLSSVAVDGGAALGANEQEVLLDIDTVMTLAPGAKVTVYNGPFNGPGSSFQALFNAAVSGGATIISNSWAYCEDQTTLADVQSLDTIFKNAQGSGVTIVNGSGDTGTTCLDGSAGVISVPADSPNATAVGATSTTSGDAFTYVSETWWDGVGGTPPTGQGGYGVSTFFSKPTYQNGLNPSAMRSIPDVVYNGDPEVGVEICEADKGGCPSGLFYGGTSYSAPAWAASVALLNQALGKKLGFLNTSLYPLSASVGFHDAASMGSDFEHVGLGSPNFGQLQILLSGSPAGTPSASVSSLVPWFAENPDGSVPDGVANDGTSKAFVVATLLDANGNPVSGKTVTLSAGGGSASISPPSAITSVDNGAAVFTVTDLDDEDLTFTATDTTDGIMLTQQPMVSFLVAPAASASIIGGPSSVPADGTSNATITVTLKDSLSRAAPGKIVTLSQSGGHSVISGPSPSVTDGSGQITFTTTDVQSENITYSATDVSDGNLAVPGSVGVNFTSGSGCASGTPTAAPGYAVSAYATGFTAQAFFYADVNFGCSGAFGLAFDDSGNLYVAHAPTGNIYKFPPGGGVANSGTLLTPSPLGPATLGLAFDDSGNLFATRAATSGNAFAGDVVQVNPSTGAIIREVSSGLSCPFTLATDPISGDLFTGGGCTGLLLDTTAIWRVHNPGGVSPTTSVYANTPGQDNFGIAFAPDGTFYVNTRAFDVARITGTSAPQPPTVTIVPNAQWGNLGLATGGMQSSGDAQFLLLNSPSTAPRNLETFDLTASPPADGVQIAGAFGALDTKVIGPDGCLYSAAGLAVYRFTDASGNCLFPPTALPPSLSLTPATMTTAQGASQSVTASLHYTSSLAAMPIYFVVTGANPVGGLANTDANGNATFTYIGKKTGTDTVIASAPNVTLSNSAQITWTAGKDSTFLTLNPSQKSGTPGNPVTITASLTDVSQHPAVAVAGQSVTLKLGGDSCMGSTDVNGIAHCTIANPTIIPGNPNRPLKATFAGTGGLVASSASANFLFSAPPENAKLNVTPKTRGFPAEVELGGVGAVSKPAIVTVTNPKSKKQNLTITFLGADDTGDFSIIAGAPTNCGSSLAAKAKCTIGLTFSPTGAGARTGTLIVADNAELNAPQMVKLKGTGKQGSLKFAPGTLNYGKQTKNTTSGPKTVNLSNANPVPMAFAASISGDYAISANNCAAMLPANSMCAISVTFTPTMTGTRNGTLTFTDTAVKSPQTVKLVGTGQ